jgi:WD40 repeat protein
MHTRPLSLASARFGRLRLLLSLSLALGALSACTGDDDDDDPLIERTPGKARLVAEDDRARVGQSMRFRCVAEDPRGERLTYSFAWGDGSGELTTSDSVASGTEGEVSRSFTREGSFLARCRASNAAGLQGAWSDGLGYTIFPATTPDPDERSVYVEVYGRGRVVSAPEGIRCPGDTSSESCLSHFPAGTRLGLTPQPEAGWRFVGWWACGTDVVPEGFTLERDMHCVARFAPEPEATVEWRRVGATLPQSPVWSPDGSQVAMLDSTLGSLGNLLQVWDAQSGRVVRQYKQPTESLVTVAWHPSRAVLALGRASGGIALIDSATGNLLREWTAHTGQVRALAWSPDGSRLASADTVSKAVRTWNAGTGASDGEPLIAVDKVRRLSWSPDGSRLALEAGTNISQWVEIHALGTTGPEELWMNAASFTWSPDGQRYAVGMGAEVRVHVTATHALAATLRGGWSVASILDWSRDGKWLGVGDTARKLFVLQADTGEVVADASQPPPSPSSLRGYDALRFHPTKPEFLVVEDFPPALDVFTVDAAAHTASRRELLPHAHEVQAVAWSRAKDRLASGGGEGRIRLWGRDGAALRTLEGHGDRAIMSLGWDGSGTVLASGGADGLIRLWRAEDGTQLREPLVHVTGQTPILLQVNSVALTPDGTRVASVAGSSPTESVRGTVKVWNVATGEEVFRFTEADNWVRTLAWTPDGRHLVAAYSGGGWSLWDSQTGALRHVNLEATFVSMTSALSPDGTRIAVARRPGLRIHDVVTGEELASRGGGFDPYALDWSPDGRYLAGGGQGGLVFVWDTQLALDPTVVGFHEISVSTVSWRADGQVFTTGGTDAALTTWRPKR